MKSVVNDMQGRVQSRFAQMSQVREAWEPQLKLRETGAVTSIASGIAKVSGLPGVGFEEVLRFPGEVHMA